MRHGVTRHIPHGISHTAWYPTRRGIPHGMVSHTAWSFAGAAHQHRLSLDPQLRHRWRVTPPCSDPQPAAHAAASRLRLGCCVGLPFGFRAVGQCTCGDLGRCDPYYIVTKLVTKEEIFDSRHHATCSMQRVAMQPETYNMCHVTYNMQHVVAR